jgi:hypothetical protein
MDRIQELDGELYRCIDTLRGLIGISTQLQNPNMVLAADWIIRTMADVHREKMVVMDRLRNEDGHFNREFIQTPETREDQDRMIYEHVSLPLPELDLEDSGPLQLADLMEEANPMDISTSPIPDAQPEDWTRFIEGEWPPITPDWQDPNWGNDDDNEPIPPPVHVSIRRGPRRRCWRRNIRIHLAVEPSQSNPCSVCYDIPDWENMMLTNCGHTFCKNCFCQWEHACINNEGAVTCPVCRKNRPVLKIFQYAPICN